MGNMASRVGNKMPRVPGFSRLEPHTAEDLAMLNKLAERDQARMRHLPSLSELALKDAEMDSLLTKLSGAVGGLTLDISNAKAVAQKYSSLGPAPDRQALLENPVEIPLTSQQRYQQAKALAENGLSSQPPSPHSPSSPSHPSSDQPGDHSKRVWSIFNSVNTTPVSARQANYREETVSPFDRVGSGAGAAGGKLKLPEMRARPISEDDSPGRVQSYILRDMFQARTALALKEQELDLASYVQLYGMDAAKIKIMMEHCCLPDVGKVAILGHQFAFARPPAWFRTDLSGQRFKSEPPENFGPPQWQKKIGMVPPPVVPADVDVYEGANKD